MNECLQDKFGGAYGEGVTANLIPGSRYRMYKAGTKTVHVGGWQIMRILYALCGADLYLEPTGNY